MTVAAARALRDGDVCFVGIGLPSTAANLARRTHAPGLVLVYESGTIGAKPTRLPLSIGDGELATTADAVVGVPEIFNYWLQPGRIDVGFLGAAQIDRFANINTTVIGGTYDDPKVRLPGAGGAPEIAASCREVIVIVRQSPRTFVEKVDFVTRVGYGAGRGDRERLGLPGRGPVQGHHRPRRARAGPGDVRADADGAARGRHGRRRAGGDGVGPAGGSRRGRDAALRAELAALRELAPCSSGAGRREGAGRPDREPGGSSRKAGLGRLSPDPRVSGRATQPPLSRR